MNNALVDLRRTLHQYPERSGEESSTAQLIVDFVSLYQPSHCIRDLGGHGVAFRYVFGSAGPTLVIRCELDALPIQEANNFMHRSKHDGISHKCGHDGHMAIVAGLSMWLQHAQFTKGTVVLLFQPSEETGQGAAAVLTDPDFLKLDPTHVFALHNLPGEPLHAICIKEGVFTATVQSLCIRLFGKKAHAAEPEHGINPTVAASELIQELAALENGEHGDSNFALLTPICIDIGAPNYGISPGTGELHYTIRTWSVAVMERVEAKIRELVSAIAEKHDLDQQMEWFEYFPETINDSAGVKLIKKVAVVNRLEVLHKTVPLRFGEDFGWFSKRYSTVFFGLGAGENQPQLHHADYDFPDELIQTGIRMFKGLISEILE